MCSQAEQLSSFGCTAACGTLSRPRWSFWGWGQHLSPSSPAAPGAAARSRRVQAGGIGPASPHPGQGCRAGFGLRIPRLGGLGQAPAATWWQGHRRGSRRSPHPAPTAPALLQRVHLLFSSVRLKEKLNFWAGLGGTGTCSGLQPPTALLFCCPCSSRCVGTPARPHQCSSPVSHGRQQQEKHRKQQVNGGCR